MKTMKQLAKRFLLLLMVLTLVLTSSILVTARKSSASSSSVTIYDSTTTFKHFDYTLNPDNSFQSGNPSSLVNTVFNTKVIENDYLKVTLLPDFGGRLLSIIYKPTGKELLYQNPVGAPYGIGEGNFYYDWLMVYGGIMPTFSEPEHGKFWLLPWNYQIVTQNSSQVSVKMTATDTINFARRPGKFDNGLTNITCEVIYTVYADKPYVEMNVRLKNNQDQSVNYEYWTCNTLAPGSTPGNTIGSETMEIVAPMTEVKSKDDWWPWLGTVDEAVNASSHLFKFDNLAHFSNWEDMGIAYANNLSGNWWGVINHDNEQGILRIADNSGATPGMKLWTWGFDQSYAVNPETAYGNSARPYIELWGGTSSEFFEDATLSPQEELEWTEYYTPTVGLTQVTNANEKAAAYLYTETDETQTTFHADVNTSFPGKTISATMSLVGSSGTTELLNTSFVSGTTSAQNLITAVNQDSIPAGEFTYQLELKDSSGDTLLKADIPYNSEGTQNPPAEQPEPTWYLFNQAVSGASPNGENMQADHSGITGWQPIKTITDSPSYWYTPALDGTYTGGDWTFTLWTNSPDSASEITIELYKVDADGSGAEQIGSQTNDVMASGTGNHPTLYTFNAPALELDNNRIMVKISKSSGADAVISYNTNDFPTRLEAPQA